MAAYRLSLGAARGNPAENCGPILVLASEIYNFMNGEILT